MNPSSTLQIAIIGSGPSGSYAAQSLLRSMPGSTITIFDRLASPFGLIRYGVAADHQHTKAITRQFDRLFQSESVQFAGDIEIGRDLALADLEAHFDAIVLATGLSRDRDLGVAGGDLAGVLGAGALTRVLNSHPDSPSILPDFGSDVVIVGAGNVALDLLRFLVKGADDYAGSDIADPALDAYLSSPAQRITLVSRSAAADSKGDPQMLKELAALPRARYSCPDPLLAGEERTSAARVAALESLIDPDRPAHPGPEVTLRFGLTPSEVLGSSRVEGVVLSSGDHSETVPATSVVTAIGFDAAEVDRPATELASLEHDLETGRVSPGLYRTGWAKRGPRGAIAENRACAKSVAEEIASDVETGALAHDPAKLGFAGLAQPIRDRAVTYTEWLTLDAHERESAPASRARRKTPNHTHMVEVARGTATNQR